MMPILRLMSLLLLLIIPEMAMGQGAELFQMKILLEDRVFNIMRGFDPDAVVNAKIEVEKSANVKLPQTLITVKSRIACNALVRRGPYDRLSHMQCVGRAGEALELHLRRKGAKESWIDHYLGD